METTNSYNGLEKRKFVRFDTAFPVMFKLYVGSRTGIITTLINGETINISLEGTLDEITRRLVTKLLEDENMNQTQTAKKLGISRSTLWRMIK